MRIQRAAAHAVCALVGLGLWIMLPDASLAECDNDPLHFPISLKLGHVKSPEFTTQGGIHAIEITAKNVLPPAELSCMMGISDGPQDPVDCDKKPLIEASWKLWSSGQVVAQGSSREMGKRGYFQGEFYAKYIGMFKSKEHEKYFLEVDLTQDGSALAVAEPHLEINQISPSPTADPDLLYTAQLPLTPSHFRSPEFEGHKGVNVISLKVLGRLPTAKEFCLLGIQATDLPKCAEASVVDFEWTVWSEGKIVATGTSDPHESRTEASMYGNLIDHCGGAIFVNRDVGFFKGRKGQKFSIEVNVTKDGSELNIAYPTLSVVKGFQPSAFAM